MLKLFPPIGLFLVLAACGKNTANVALDGTLTILAPTYSYSAENMRDEWVIIGNIEQVASRPLIENKEPYLAISGGLAPFAALRPINAQLLATPFLSWEWRIIDKFENHSPLRLTIGFSDNGSQREGLSKPMFWGTFLPTFSRSLTIEWGHSALQRGSLQVYNKKGTGLPFARYIARGGQENQNRWWHEAVDLSNLYAKAWPGLDMRDTEIVFAGFIVNKVDSKMSGHLREIRLSR